jgi:hypothetical protein
MRLAWLRLIAADDGGKGDPAQAARAASGAQQPAEDLLYRIELWNEGGTTLERVLAVAASGAIAYGAYYAAAREYPESVIILTHKGRVLIRWNGKSH